MCCLKYEHEAYESLLKKSPKLDAIVQTPDGRDSGLCGSFARKSKG